MARCAPRAPRIALLLALFAPQAAFAGSAVVTPLIAKGVEPKVSQAVTGLVSSELDFSGAYETVTELPQPPATLNAACLTQVTCLAAIAKAGGADAVLTGSVGPGAQGLQIQLVLYDGGKIKSKQTFETAGDPATLADSAGKWVKSLISGTPPAATAAAEAPPSFDSEEEDEFAFDAKTPAATAAKPSKTRTENKANPRELADEDEDEEEVVVSSSSKSKSEAAERAREEAEAKAEAEARAKAKAEAEARAKADAEAKAKARAEAERKAREEADRLAREEAEEDQRREDARNAAEAARRAREEEEEAQYTKASASKSTSSSSSASKSTSKPKVEEEDEEDFEFGSSAAAIEIETEDEPEEEEEVAPPPRSSSSSSRSSSSSGKQTTSSSSRTASKPVVEDEDEPVEDEELVDLDEEDPPSRSKSRDEDEEDPPSRSKSRDDDEDSSSSRSRSSSSRDDEDDRSSSRSRSSSSRDDDDRSSSRSSSARSSSRYDDLDGPSRSKSSDKKPGVALIGRVGYSRYFDFNFLTYGGEISIPVAPVVHILAGLEGFSTQRQYGEQACQKLADDAEVDVEDYDCNPWQTILPVNVGVIYKSTKSRVRPYGGIDFTFTPYTTVPDIALGARARGGADFMIADSFGLNLNLSVGIMWGEKLEQTQEGIQNLGLIPQVSGGTIVQF